MKKTTQTFQVLFLIVMPFLVGCVSYPASHEAWDNGWRYENVGSGSAIES